ncbi:MAG: hypothetical protein ACE5F7_05225 [Nitrospiria bacterium]
MNKKDCIKLFGTAMLAMIVAACGSSGGGSGLSSEGGVASTLKATALKGGLVVASNKTTGKIDTMLALLSGKEAVAAVSPGDCADDAKGFSLSDGFVCLNSAYVVFEEIELEQEGINEGDDRDDDVEAGPFVFDLLGTANDGVGGSISMPVPDGTFNKIEIKIGDLDDNGISGGGGADDGSLDDSPGSLDDNPKNMSVADANSAGLAGKSMVIKGTAHTGPTDTTGTAFTFKTNLEAKIEMPFTVPAGANPVVDGSSLITVVDLAPGFVKLAHADVTAGTFEADGTFGPTDFCSAPKNKAQGFACDGIRSIDLFDDDDNDDIAEAGEHRGGDDNGDDTITDDGTVRDD